MTPTEKAKALFERFQAYADDSMASLHTNSIICALICVVEVLNELEDVEDGYRMDRVEYWERVKTEIKKL